MKPQTFRTFIGIPVASAIQSQLDHWLDLRTQFCHTHQIQPPAKERLVAKENRHLTLHFLGDLTEEQRQQLELNLKVQLSDIPSFDLMLDQLSHFPDAKSPILAATGRATSELQQLHQTTAEAIEQSGLSRLLSHKPYRPHITLIRAKGKAAPEENTLLQQLEKSDIQLPVNEVVLYESILTPNGSVYKTAKTYQLRSV
jgi:2'-5' RNA ligase